jgi:RecA/RadA recombinase
MSFEKFSRTGGKALDFYCHTVLWLANINKLKKKGRSVGVTIKAKTTKSKTPRPYREIFFPILFDYGIDSVTASMDFLFDRFSYQASTTFQMG